MMRALALRGLLTISVIAAFPSLAKVRTMPVKAFLCDSGEHAIQFADVVAAGESEEIARYRVGRSAGADACGWYSGVAAIESEGVRLAAGTAYKLTAYRFTEDQRIAWRADRTFAPPSSDWDL